MVYLLENLIQNKNFSGEMLIIYFIFLKAVDFSKNHNLVKIGPKILRGFELKRCEVPISDQKIPHIA